MAAGEGAAHAGAPAPTAVLFDIGNVILRFDPQALYIKVLPDPEERRWFLNTVCSLDWHVEHDRGAPMAQTIPALVARFPAYSDAIEAWRDRAAEMLPALIAPTVEAIEALDAAGAPLFALTNMPAEWVEPITARSPVFSRFRDIVVSAHEGLIKPDPALYRIALDRMGRRADEVLFIDDSAPNIEAARTLGFDVHHFADPAALRPALEARGLL
jgi:2-haloacid dehalogenase/putative hydrolase of the HAD superfamily